MIENIKLQKFAFRALFFGISLLLIIVLFSLMGQDASAADPVNEDLDLVGYGDNVELYAGKNYTWKATVSDADWYKDITKVVLHLGQLSACAISKTSRLIIIFDHFFYSIFGITNQRNRSYQFCLLTKRQHPRNQLRFR